MTTSTVTARTGGQVGLAGWIVFLLSSRWLHLTTEEAIALTGILGTLFTFLQNFIERRVERDYVPPGYSGKHTES